MDNEDASQVRQSCGCRDVSNGRLHSPTPSVRRPNDLIFSHSPGPAILAVQTQQFFPTEGPLDEFGNYIHAYNRGLIHLVRMLALNPVLISQSQEFLSISAMPFCIRNRLRFPSRLSA